MSGQAIQHVEELIMVESPKFLSDMIDEVLGKKDFASLKQIEVTSDLYIVKESGEQIFVELKSPKPNKDQCEKGIRRILYTHLILNERHPKVQAYFAFPYNPFGSYHHEYRWNIVHRYLPNGAVRIGEDFWEIVGGNNTYNDLLEIYKEIGKEMSDEINKTLKPDSNFNH